MMNIKDKKYILVFKTDYCVNCQELIEKLDDANLKINYYVVDHSSECEELSKFNIMVAPTTILIDNGQEVDRFYGNKSISFIKEFIKE